MTRESGVNFPEGPGLEDELDSSSCVELSQEQTINFKECVAFACLLSLGGFFFCNAPFLDLSPADLGSG